MQGHIFLGITSDTFRMLAEVAKAYPPPLSDVPDEIAQKAVLGLPEHDLHRFGI